MKQDPRIEKILEQIIQYTTGNFEVREKPSAKGDELDAIVIGLNTLAEEAEASGRMIKDYEKRVNSLMNVLLRYTVLDFSEKADVSNIGDEIDAIAIGLNTMAEELIAARETEERNMHMLNETNHFLDTIIENLPNMLFVKEAKELRFIRFNKAGEDLLGYTRDQLIGRNDYDFFPKEQADFFTKKDREVLKTTGITDIEEEAISTKSGDKILHTKKIPIIENGQPAYLLGISEDITQRKAMENALKLSEERYRRIVENVRDYAIFMISPEGIVLNWNAGAEAIKGYKADEIIGKHFSIFYTNSDKRAHHPERNIEKTIKLGRYEDEGWRVKKDGSLFWADVVFTSVYDDKDKLIGITKITRDLTERKQAEEKEKRLNEELDENVRMLQNVNAELEAFTYSVSHDLRAPLRAIHGYVKILEEEYTSKLDEDARVMMDSVKNNAKKMGQLIDDLLALSRMGRKELQKTEVDMEELVKTALDEIRKAQGEITAEVIIHPLPKAQADHNLLLQVLINLISNAIKYSSRREKPVVEIGAKEDNGVPVYYIKDNGTGFDMKYYNKLFGIFQRLHDASEFEGTGVGLAIVKRIIARHGGKVWAEAALEKGATFYFTLQKQTHQ
jgi:PAS domain S-box-containing protein